MVHKSHSVRAISIPQSLREDRSSSAYTLAVFAALASLGALHPEGARLRIDDIAAASKVGHRTVRRELGWLISAGWLEANYVPGDAAIYHL